MQEILNPEQTKILETDKRWAKAAAEAKDIDQIVSFWSDDAKIFAPAMPVIEGNEAIRQFVQNTLATPGFSIRWKTNEVVVSSDSSIAYATGTNQITFTNPQGEWVTLYGKAVTVWRKEPSGDWKCVIDIWNDDPGRQE